MITRVDLKRSSRENLIRLARALNCYIPPQFTTKELVDIVWHGLKMDSWLARARVKEDG